MSYKYREKLKSKGCSVDLDLARPRGKYGTIITGSGSSRLLSRATCDIGVSLGWDRSPVNSLQEH